MMNSERAQGQRSAGLDRPAQMNRQAASPNAGQQKKKKPTPSSKPKWLRVTLRVMRILFVPTLLIVAILAGLWVGYTKLGKEPSSEIFQLETWKHVFDLIFADS